MEHVPYFKEQYFIIYEPFKGWKGHIFTDQQLGTKIFKCCLLKWRRCPPPLKPRLRYEGLSDWRPTGAVVGAGGGDGQSKWMNLDLNLQCSINSRGNTKNVLYCQPLEAPLIG